MPTHELFQSPILSVVLPSYNAEKTLAFALQSLVEVGNRLDIIVVDDGSTDHTLQIAQLFQKRYSSVRVIHQENKGHGGAINTGLSLAKAPWFKVCDSDDAFNLSALKRLLDFLEFDKRAVSLDLVITNYVYMICKRKKLKDTLISENIFDFTETDTDLNFETLEKEPELLEIFLQHLESAASFKPQQFKTRKVSYKNSFPVNKVLAWRDFSISKKMKMLMMHALCYRTEFLLNQDFKLPEHCFYEDNCFVYEPLLNVKKLIYLNLNLYQYRIGSAGQSVSIDRMLLRYKDQLLVTRRLLFHENLEAVFLEKSLKDLLYGHLDRVYAMGLLLLTLQENNREEILQERDALMKDLKAFSPKMAKRLNRGTFTLLVKSLFKIKPESALKIYRQAFNFFGFV